MPSHLPEPTITYRFDFSNRDFGHPSPVNDETMVSPVVRSLDEWLVGLHTHNSVLRVQLDTLARTGEVSSGIVANLKDHLDFGVDRITSIVRQVCESILSTRCMPRSL